jgi:hypothetical protein
LFSAVYVYFVLILLAVAAAAAALYEATVGPIFIVKGKAIPLQALTDPEGSRSLRLPDFKTIGT